jgi:hypothetical protein
VCEGEKKPADGSRGARLAVLPAHAKIFPLVFCCFIMSFVGDAVYILVGQRPNVNKSLHLHMF